MAASSRHGSWNRNLGAHIKQRVNWEWWQDVGLNGLQQPSSACDGLTKTSSFAPLPLTFHIISLLVNATHSLSPETESLEIEAHRPTLHGD